MVLRAVRVDAYVPRVRNSVNYLRVSRLTQLEVYLYCPDQHATAYRFSHILPHTYCILPCILDSLFPPFTILLRLRNSLSSTRTGSPAWVWEHRGPSIGCKMEIRRITNSMLGISRRYVHTITLPPILRNLVSRWLNYSSSLPVTFVVLCFLVDTHTHSYSFCFTSNLSLQSSLLFVSLVRLVLEFWLSSHKTPPPVSSSCFNNDNIASFAIQIQFYWRRGSLNTYRTQEAVIASRRSINQRCRTR